MNGAILWHAVQSVLTLAILGAVGYFLARGKWFTPETKVLLPKLVMVVSLPPYMLYNITHLLTRDDLLHLAYGCLVPFASILLTFGASLLLAKALKVRHKRHGIFCVSFTASNTIFIGLPVNLALFGEQALPYVLLYYFANTIYLWTIGNYLLAASGESGQNVRLFSGKTLKQVFSPPLLGMLSGVILLLCGLPLPEFAANAAKYLGSLTTPLAIMILGITMQGMPFSSIKIDRELLFIILGRFLLSPLTIILLAHLVPLPDLMRRVFVIQASLPVVVSVVLLSSLYKSDPEFAAVVVSATTLLSIFTIPLYMVVVSL